MVLPAVLKRRHSLKGVRLLSVIKKIRSGQPSFLKDFARIQKDTRTDELSLEEIGQHIMTITGEDLREILQLADREDTIEEARWALHCVILHANEFGQPRGQDLQEDQVSTSPET